ncbi:hypothetical protein BV22DRAFT_818288 [Leucogyrophana mollusca]|uniref:Uncharacterized protein n=1 Tax=Leucogyrophana mollusca TaxID=85980 RepID=A0ACB8B496_9AGAM|nr:hypothetical protein BV22DRAFT_818288 [Leucogyrophana mollusca]
MQALAGTFHRSNPRKQQLPCHSPADDHGMVSLVSVAVSAHFSSSEPSSPADASDPKIRRVLTGSGAVPYLYLVSINTHIHRRAGWIDVQTRLHTYNLVPFVPRARWRCRPRSVIPSKLQYPVGGLCFRACGLLLARHILIRSPTSTHTLSVGSGSPPGFTVINAVQQISA